MSAPDDDEGFKDLVRCCAGIITLMGIMIVCICLGGWKGFGWFLIALGFGITINLKVLDKK